MSNNCGNNRRISQAASGGHQNSKITKENIVDISDTSRYYSPYEWNNFSRATRYTLLSDPKRMTAKEKISTGESKRYTNEKYSLSRLLINLIIKKLKHYNYLPLLLL